MKKDNYLFKSERLGFRNWKNGDLDEFIKLNSDDKVMEHFPKSLSKNETGKLFERVLEELKKIKKNTLSGLDQNSKEANAGKLKKLFIGGKTFKNRATIFGDISHLNKDDDYKIDGIIGYEVLSKQTTLLSFARKEIVFIE
jgi:hypothetical protein